MLSSNSLFTNEFESLIVSAFGSFGCTENDIAGALGFASALRV